MYRIYHVLLALLQIAESASQRKSGSGYDCDDNENHGDVDDNDDDKALLDQL